MRTVNNTYRLIAFLLAILVFITSVGFTVDMHFCRGDLKSVSLFGKAKNCHEIAKKKCPHHQKMMAQNPDLTADKMDCCENKTYYFQNDQNKDTPIHLILYFQLQSFLITPVAVCYTIFDIHKSTSTFTHYKPPLIHKSIPIFIQSFLL